LEVVVSDEKWPRIAVLGAGAVACYFGGMLARAGAPVTFIGRSQHVEEMTRHGLLLESLTFKERVPATASETVEAARDCDIVLFCVKTLDTEKAAKALAPNLAPGAIVVSLQNGVDNVERIRAACGIEATPAVVYVGAVMAGPGHVKHNGRGDLIVGNPRGGHQDEPERVAGLFARSGVPCKVSTTILADLWTKMSINCAYNAVSALGRTKYGRIGQHPQAREVLRLAIEETVAVASAAGIVLPQEELIEAAYRLGEAMSEATSSTAQDIQRRKPTEIDSLNGYVARRGAELGVPTPVNMTLHALVKLLEEAGG
jgi:2-dehydropantoate 2-reductase